MPSVLFVADKFSNETRSAREAHPGGAELTDAAALAACPWPVERRRFAELDLGRFDQADLIVVGNSQTATREQLAAIARTRRHVLFEHDVRICLWNGNFPSAGDPAHRGFQRCWCPHPRLAELFRSARGVVFLTERQRRVYDENPFFDCARDAVLGSSLFSEQFFDRVEARRREPSGNRRGTAVVYSPNAIKGFAPSRRWALDRGREVREIKNEPPERVLETFAGCASLVYLPIGLEPAGRLPVEARLLGCEVVVNEHVGVAGEPFWRGTGDDALAWLRGGPRRFWQLVEGLASHEPEPFDRVGRGRAWVDGLIRATRHARFATLWLPPLSPETRRRTRAIEAHAPW